jgi:phosphoribosylglycinamide formyltransferase-1
VSYKVGFCVSGKGMLARAAIRNSEELQIKPEILIAEYKADPELESFCADHKIKFVKIPKMPRDKFNECLKQYLTNPILDLVCLTFDKIISPELVNCYKGKMINVHPGLLPSFVGKNALQRTEIHGVRFAGATIHEVTERVDAGPIISQCVVSLGFDEKSTHLGLKIYQHLEPMFLQTIKWYANGRIYKDEIGRIWVKNASYGKIPISPSIELKI